MRSYDVQEIIGRVLDCPEGTVMCAVGKAVLEASCTGWDEVDEAELSLEENGK
jgi:hypothetical protein